MDYQKLRVTERLRRIGAERAAALELSRVVGLARQAGYDRAKSEPVKLDLPRDLMAQVISKVVSDMGREVARRLYESKGPELARYATTVAEMVTKRWVGQAEHIHEIKGIMQHRPPSGDLQLSIEMPPLRFHQVLHVDEMNMFRGR